MAKATAPDRATDVRTSEVWPLVAVIGVAALVHSYESFRSQDAPKELVVLMGTALFAMRAAWGRYRSSAGGAASVTPGPLTALAFLILILLAASRALDPHLAVRRAALWTAGIVLLLEARARLASPAARRRVALGLTGVGAVVALWGLGQWFFGGVLDREGVVVAEPVSTLGNTSFAASFVVMLLPLAVALAADRTRSALPRRAALVTAVLVTGHLLVTKSRTDYVALVAAAFAALGLGLLARGRRRALLGWGVALAVAIGGFVVLLGTPWIGRTDTIRVRELIWKSSVPLALERPAVGIGLTDFAAEFPPHRDVEEYELSLRRDVSTPHNDPLEIAIEAGWPAALLWLTLAVVALRAATIAARRAGPGPEARLHLAFAAAVVAGFVSGLASSPLSHPPHLALLAVALGGALAGGDRPRLFTLPRGAGIAAGALATVALLVAGWYAFNHVRADRALARLPAATDEAGNALAERAIGLEPHNVDAVILHGQWLRNDLNPENARRAYEHYQRILAVRPHDVRILVLIAQLHRWNGDHGVALESVNRALEINPAYEPARVERFDVHLAIAREAMRDGDRETAAEHLRPTVRQMVEAGRAGRARARLVEIVAAAPETAPPLFELIAIDAAARGDDDVARAYVESLAASGRASGDVWTRLERDARERGEEALASSYQIRAKLAYAYEYALAGDHDMTERHLSRAERLGVHPSEAIMVRAILAVKRGDHADALNLVEDSVAEGFADLGRLRQWQYDVFDPISGNNPRWQAIVRGIAENAQQNENRGR